MALTHNIIALAQHLSQAKKWISTYGKLSVDKNRKESFPQKGKENCPLLISTSLYGQERKTVCCKHCGP